MRWLAPWQEINEGAALVAELHRETSAGHPLFGAKVRAIARRLDCDDVLFELLDNSSRVALVHLTYNVEQDANWPHTEFFASLQKFALQRMASDHEAFDT
jgi:hypothetical protein